MAAEAQGMGRTVEEEGFREAGRSLMPQGRVSHGFYPKLNRKSQKAFKQKSRGDMIQFTLSKITLATR